MREGPQEVRSQVLYPVFDKGARERENIILQRVSRINIVSAIPPFHPEKGRCPHGVCSLSGFPGSPLPEGHAPVEPAKHRVLSAEEVKILFHEMLSDAQIKELEEAGEIDIVYTVPDVARVRLNIYKKHVGLGAPLRITPQQ